MRETLLVYAFDAAMGEFNNANGDDPSGAKTEVRMVIA